MTIQPLQPTESMTAWFFKINEIIQVINRVDFEDMAKTMASLEGLAIEILRRQRLTPAHPEFPMVSIEGDDA